MSSLMKSRLENKYEKLYWPRKIAGIDEAGRGPLCGPLTVGGCVLPPFFDHPDINDSKKISAGKREKLYDLLVREALWWKVEIVDPTVIDRLNIYQATREAMERLARQAEADIILTDAVPVCAEKIVHSFPHADSLSISVAAASILAKVTRDRIMMELDERYPEYGYARHKGYPTRDHLQALERYGIKEFYRFSYAPVKRLLKK